MKDPLDEKIGRILFSGELDGGQQLSDAERTEVEALRHLENKMREMLDFDPAKVEPAQDRLPDALRARLEMERLRFVIPGAGKTSGSNASPASTPGILETSGSLLVTASENKPTPILDLRDILAASTMAAMANPMAAQDAGSPPEIGEAKEGGLVSANDEQRPIAPEITQARVRMFPWWAASAAALFVCLLVPLAFWVTAERGGQDVTIKSTDTGARVPTVLLTPGSETGFTTPRVIWFSSNHRSARISIRSLVDPTREWVSEKHGGELAWSDFLPTEPLNAGKEYRLEILVAGKSVIARQFKVTNSAIPLEVGEKQDPAEIIAATQQLRTEGRLRDALMRLGAVTDTLRKRPDIRELRGAISAEILAKEEN